MSRQPLTLARAKQLARDAVKNDDTTADTLIELFVGATPSTRDAEQESIRTAILKEWYCETEDFRVHFREYVGDSDNAQEQEESEPIESNAPAS